MSFYCWEITIKYSRFLISIKTDNFHNFWTFFGRKISQSYWKDWRQMSEWQWNYFDVRKILTFEYINKKGKGKFYAQWEKRKNHFSHTWFDHTAVHDDFFKFNLISMQSEVCEDCLTAINHRCWICSDKLLMKLLIDFFLLLKLIFCIKILIIFSLIFIKLFCYTNKL